MFQISVVIPARDEEQFIGSCIESIKTSAQLASTALEIVVVLNRCTDRTEEIARSFGARIVHCDAKNLSEIRNCGVRAATHEHIVTIDADSRMSRSLLTRIRKSLEDADGTVGGGVLILPERWSLGILVTGLMLLPIALKDRISGGAFYFRRNDFEAINGFDPAWRTAEDIDFARRLKRHGATSGRKFRLILSGHIITSCRKFDRFGDWYFVKRPALFTRLLKGGTQEEANQIWYDFPRDAVTHATKQFDEKLPPAGLPTQNSQSDSE